MTSDEITILISILAVVISIAATVITAASGE